jgi:hypothetical protein
MRRQFLCPKSSDRGIHFPRQGFFERIWTEGFRREVGSISAINEKIWTVIWAFRAVLAARLPFELISFVANRHTHQNGAFGSAAAVVSRRRQFVSGEEFTTARNQILQLFGITVLKSSNQATCKMPLWTAFFAFATLFFSIAFGLLESYLPAKLSASARTVLSFVGMFILHLYPVNNKVT